MYGIGRDTKEDINPRATDKRSVQVDFYTLQIAIVDADTGPWTTAQVDLYDQGGIKANSCVHKSSTGKIAYYERILQRDDDTAYTVHVVDPETSRDTNTERTVKATSGERKATFNFYTTTVRVTCSDVSQEFAVSIDNDVDTYSNFTCSGTGTTKTYTQPHVYARELGAEERVYKLALGGVSTAGAPASLLQVTSGSKTKTLVIRKIDYYNYEAQDPQKKDVFNQVDYATGWVLDNCNETEPSEPYNDGFSFDGWGTNGWTKGETSYNRFDFGTKITSDRKLYAHYLTPTVRINQYVRTDANGNISSTGTCYRMANTSISGFNKGNTINWQ